MQGSRDRAETVVERVTAITRINGEMASASCEQHDVADAIRQRILSINTVAERISANAQQRMAESSELADLAGELERRLSAYQYSK